MPSLVLKSIRLYSILISKILVFFFCSELIDSCIHGYRDNVQRLIVLDSRKISTIDREMIISVSIVALHVVIFFFAHLFLRVDN